MGKAALKVLERKEKAKKVRRNGLTPGVIYGEGIEKGIPIKFEMLKLNQLVKGNIKNAKLNVNLGKENMFCIIKEFQRDPVGGNIIHVDMQSVYAEEVIKLKIPIIYSGLNSLELKRLVLQIDISELEIEGHVNILPEAVHIDISSKDLGEKITLKDLKLDKSIKVHADENEILAVIVAHKEIVEETEETSETAE